MNFNNIVKHYEECLDKYGDNHLGVNWNSEESANIRYQIMIELIKCGDNKNISLLDFGCGTSALYSYIVEKKIKNIKYYGLDISKKFIELSRQKFSQNNYYCLDILKDNFDNSFDYIICNGVFTCKHDLSFENMLSLWEETLVKLFEKADIGIAFNVMSKYVDWENKSLFHLPIDYMLDFVTKNLSRNFIIRSDYKLFEYTTYIYK